MDSPDHPPCLPPAPELPSIPVEGLALVLEALPMAAMAVSSTGTIMAANQRALDMFGLAPGVIGDPSIVAQAALLSTPVVDDPKQMQDLLTRASETDAEELGGSLSLSDGREIKVDSRPLRLHNETFAHLWCWSEVGSVRGIEASSHPANSDLSADSDRLRRYLDMAEVILVVLDRDGCIRMINDTGCRTLGYPESGLLGRSWFEVALATDWREPLWDIFVQAMSGLAPEQSRFEHPVRTPGGERLIAWRTRTLFDAGESPAGVVSIGEDITDQRAMEDALRASEHTFASVFHTSPDAIAIIQADDGLCMDVNPAFEELSGYTSDEAIGSAVISRMGIWPTATDRDRILGQLRQCGTVRNIESRYRTSDGRESHVLVSAGLVELQGRECILLMFKDIADRIAAEEALRASEQRFRSYFDQDLIAIAMFRLDGGWTDVNPAYQTLIGYDREELKAIPWPELTPAEDLAREAGLLQQIREQKLNRYVIEKKLRHRDGNLIPVMASVGAVRDPDGSLQYLIGIVQDISVQKRQADQLLQAQKMEAVGQLTGGIAHDFNNLLTIIMGNLELLQLSLPQDSEDQSLVEDALSAAGDGRELTRQMLIFSRGKSLEASAVDVGDLVRSIDRLLKRALPQNVRLVQDARNDAGIRALVDAHQFQSVLVNLMLNAGDAMPDGGEVRIEIGYADPATVAQLNLEPGTYVQVDVRDQGLGMSGDVLSRACEPFFTTKEVGRGTGLGLSMAYTFLKQSGGHLWLESEPGGGTGVHMVLPAADGAEAIERDRMDSQPLAGGSEHILVVEDESRVRQLAVRHLRDLGYTVASAGSGAEAIELLEQDSSFRLLFTDVVMPGSINGYQLADIVRAGRPRLKVLLTTGFDRGARATMASGSLHWPVLAKPYTKKQLARIIRQVLDDRPQDDRTGVTK